MWPKLTYVCSYVLSLNHIPNHCTAKQYNTEKRLGGGKSFTEVIASKETMNSELIFFLNVLEVVLKIALKIVLITGGC